MMIVVPLNQTMILLLVTAIGTMKTTIGTIKKMTNKKKITCVSNFVSWFTSDIWIRLGNFYLYFKLHL